ncbi:hypothetical protein KI688_003375 [Linnemannia hyalina]|uniref:Reverse transcriptase zinc-binding domain-containing protein n=1 Tax=Linnemannia hyalina TaxID=64524 RepID=A0A9P7XNL2_9FUNG|nr:hypothetical protein KI688_003375 [Linnemannia hyalina]
MVEPLCRVCGTDLETSQHLLFSCPKKLEPLFPDPDPVKPLHDIPIFILIDTILASVWRYHHAIVREDQAFEPRMVLAAVDLAITQVRAQLAEKKRQSEEREPPPPVELPLVDNSFPT